MRTAIITIGLVILLMSGSASALNNKYFYSSGQIVSGETWDGVLVYNDNTIVDMLGGQIGYLTTYNNSTFNLLDGQITSHITIGITGQGTMNVSGGTINIPSDFVVNMNSVCNISGGNVTADRLKTYPGSSVEFAGGILDFDTIEIHGELTIKGGSLHIDNAYVSPWYDETIKVNVYGYGFNYNPNGGTYGGGLLTGYLLDNNFFSIDQLSASEFQRFNLIPEPSTFILLAIGASVFYRRNYKKN